MLTLVLMVLILTAVYFMQQAYPFLAGMLPSLPMKIVATSLMALGDGGIPRLQEAIGGMLLGQLI
jgi:hypothetical protein